MKTPKRGTLTISKLSTGDDHVVRIMVRRKGEPASKRLLLGVTFGDFTRVLMGESEVEVSIERDFDE